MLQEVNLKGYSNPKPAAIVAASKILVDGGSKIGYKKSKLFGLGNLRYVGTPEVIGNVGMREKNLPR
jgi:hypothetical protein